MIACGGSSGGNNPNPTPSGGTLTLSAPSQLPTGLSVESYQAFLTLNNASNESATNLQFSIPADLNTAGSGSVTVSNEASGNNCKNIPAHGSCSFPVTIYPANAKAGSFGVQVSEGTTVDKLKSAIGLKSSSAVLTANIGLSNVALSQEPGADGVTFLYDPVVSQNPDGSTSVTVIAIVGPNAGGQFDEIHLTDANGNSLDYEAISGNVGAELTNLNPNAVVTLVLNIPAGTTGTQFYAYTTEDGNASTKGPSQSKTAQSVSVVAAGTGILSLSPQSANLSDTESTVTLTYTNKGTGDITDLAVGTASSPLSASSNTCSSTLSPNSSCTVVLKSNAAVGTAGSGTFSTSYTGGTQDFQYNYAGKDPESGISLSAENNFSFTSNTVNTTSSTQVTLKNQSTTSQESDFALTLPTYFTASSGTGSSACGVSSNKITTELAAGGSCTFTLKYTNSEIIPSIGANMTINYKYHGDKSASDTKTLSYSTTQASASLSFSPSSANFGTIIANGEDSATKEFTVTNAGPDVANLSTIVAGNGFTVDSNTETACRSNATLASGSTCTVKVKYGPTTTVANSDTANLTVNYASATNTSKSELTTATLTGTARAANSADPYILNVAFSNSSGGDGESVGTQFALAQNSTQTLTLTYKNSGASDAKDFTVNTSSLSSGYTLDDNGCNDFKLESNNNNSCAVKLLLNTTTAQTANLDLSTLKISYDDEQAGLVSDQGSILSGRRTTVYANVYTPASVTASLVSVTGTSITSVTQGESFSVKFALAGGYNVTSPAEGFVNLPSGMTASPSTCTLTSSLPVCGVVVTTSEDMEPGDYDLNLISFTDDRYNPSPNPLTIGVETTFACSAETPCIFVSDSTTSGQIAVAGDPATATAIADEICDTDPNKPDGSLSWKALLVTSNRNFTNSGNSFSAHDWPLKPDTMYFNPSGEPAFTTNSLGQPPFQAKNAVDPTGDNKYVWTGLVTTTTVDETTWLSGIYYDIGTVQANNNQCNAWTSVKETHRGIYGLSNSKPGWARQTSNGCIQTAHLYCVSQ